MANIPTSTPTHIAPEAVTGGLSTPVQVGGAFLCSTGLALVFQAVDAIFEISGDRGRHEGPLESLTSIAIVGFVGMALALLVAWALRNKPGVAAIVLGGLAVITLPLFWSGTPAVFGASAHWRAGLTRDGRPLSGAARGFGIVGLVVAIIVIIVLIVLNLGFLLTS